MILQALKEYYDRKAADPDAQMAPPGFEWKEIPFVLVLDGDGNPVSLNCTYEGTGKDRRAKKYLVPQGVKRTAIDANVMWDNVEYVLGISQKSDEQGAKKRHEDFTRKVSSLQADDDKGLNAVKKFLEREDKVVLVRLLGTEFDELVKNPGANISFQLQGSDGLVVESAVVRASHLENTEAEECNLGTCLVTGETDRIERILKSIQGVYNTLATGASLVSFKLDPFRSYGKVQGANSPIGKTAAFAYTTALNHLLGKDSRQRMQVGDASTVFWSEKVSALETGFADFFGEPPKDDPDRNTRAVESLFQSVRTGAPPEGGGKTRFYVLGLAPNAARISIRFWIADTIEGMSKKICAHFEDIRIVHGPRDRDTLSLFRLLVATAALGKSENIPPNLAGDTMRAILEGLPYPQTLLQAAVRRIRAEHEITHPRAALIKACLNRNSRSSNPNGEREITVSLDESNTNIGYRLGRLFAALEKVQQEANPGINATIRDRFYGAASGTPVAVFANLMRLKNHHLAKLDNAGRRVNFERLIGRIMEGIGDFPAHLSLADQGRFAIGYYHQMQDFFTKKSETAE